MNLTSIFLSGSFLVSGVAMAGGRPVPVMFGGESGLDACSSAMVTGLDPHGDGFLAVKSGPGISYKRKDKVYNGMNLNICDYKSSSPKWIGVVYGGGRECGTMVPVRVRMPYTGPCKFGWVHKNWVGHFAD